MKQIQIPESLFYNLIAYHLCGIDTSSEEIKKALNDKLDAILRHEFYTQYKTNPDEKKREEARKAYLDKVGIQPDFRW